MVYPLARLPRHRDARRRRVRRDPQHAQPARNARLRSPRRSHVWYARPPAGSRRRARRRLPGPISASAIVTAAEPIWGTFPRRARKSGCRAANRNPPSSPEAGRGSGRRRRERRGQSAALRSISARCERPTPGPRRARCGRRAGVHPPPGRARLAPASAQEQRRRADQSYPCEAGVGRTAPPRPREQWAAGRAARRRLSLSWRSGGLHLAFGARPLRSSPPLCRRLPDTCVSSREVDPRRPRRPVPSCIARAFESGRKSWRRAP
jgi:hypothetical protein